MTSKEDEFDKFVRDWEIFTWISRNSVRDKDGFLRVTGILQALHSLTDEEKDAIEMMTKMEKINP